MQIFVSWSGSKARRLAELLCEWVPSVIQAVDPWMSTDIHKGTLWQEVIVQKLRDCPVGIVCLTRHNLKSGWLLFEAGALSISTSVKEGRACTLLLDLKQSDLEDPLAMFQHTQALDKVDMRRLIGTINDSLGSERLDEKRLDRVFDMWWPEFERRVKDEILPVVEDERTNTPVRDMNELVEEILERVRDIEKNVAPRVPLYIDATVQAVPANAIFRAPSPKITTGPNGPFLSAAATGESQEHARETPSSCQARHS